MDSTVDNGWVPIWCREQIATKTKKHFLILQDISSLILHRGFLEINVLLAILFPLGVLRLIAQSVLVISILNNVWMW